MSASKLIVPVRTLSRSRTASLAPSARSFAQRASNCTILYAPLASIHIHISIPSPCAILSSRPLLHIQELNSNSPVRPLLIQHAMSAAPAPDRLSALQTHGRVAVAARVFDGARGVADYGLGLRGCGGGVGGHFWGGSCRFGVGGVEWFGGARREMW